MKNPDVKLGYKNRIQQKDRNTEERQNWYSTGNGKFSKSNNTSEESLTNGMDHVEKRLSGPKYKVEELDHSVKLNDKFLKKIWKEHEKCLRNYENTNL